MCDERTPTLGIAFLAGPANIRGLEELAKLARDSGVDYLQVRPFHSCLAFDVRGHVSAVKRRFDSKAFAVVASLQKYRNVRGGEIAPRTYAYCHISQLASTICANEKVYVCCHQRNTAQLCIGDLREQSFARIMRGNRRASVVASIDVRQCQGLCRGDHVNRQLQILAEGNKLPMWNSNPPSHVEFL